MLDGFPRNWEQAKMLDAVTDIDVVIHIIMRTDVLKVVQRPAALHNLSAHCRIMTQPRFPLSA